MTEIIAQACQHLSQGGVVAIPTETVYGLAADATNDTAIAQVFAIKNRPFFAPLILHPPGIARALTFGEFPPKAIDLANAFWAPGTAKHRPLTLVVKLNRSRKVSKLVTAGLEFVGIRVPNHPIVNELLDIYPNPIAAPSANISAQVSATNANIVRETLGERLSYIIDGGQCTVGIESTVVDTSQEPFTILRYGGTNIEEIAEIIGYMPLPAPTTERDASGQRHYAPKLPLYMDQVANVPGDAFLGFGECCFSSHVVAPSNIADLEFNNQKCLPDSTMCNHSKSEYNLSPTGDLVEAAANLFRMIHEVDDPERYNGIRVAPIPAMGLGVAINDRLWRASAPLRN
jgi:L-threonylcarbamoyladenylate synthase